jgi:thiol-disulfide isomerase/thioredoxin
MRLKTFIFMGFALVLGAYLLTFNQKTVPEQCRNALERVKSLKIEGELAALKALNMSILLKPLNFKNAENAELTQSDFHGKLTLLNLWATWCVPCRLEMPALSHLQDKMGGNDFQVLAINIDQRNLERPKDFLKEVKISNLGFYHDATAKIFSDLKAQGLAFGMPTTLLLDEQGCVLASLAGPAEWASQDAINLINSAIKSKKP